MTIYSDALREREPVNIHTKFHTIDILPGVWLDKNIGERNASKQLRSPNRKQPYRPFTMSNTIYADVADVNIGNLSIEGLKLETGQYAIAVPQVCRLFPVPPKNSTRTLQRILNKSSREYSFLRAKTELNSKAVNVLDLDDFLVVLKHFYKLGNQMAIDLAFDLIALSLHQLFADRFNDKFEREERQEFLKNRPRGIDTRNQFTDAVKSYLHSKRVPKSQHHHIFEEVSDSVNLALFNKKAWQLRQERGLCKGDSLRDTHPSFSLKQIDYLEHHATICMNKYGADPVSAIRSAIDFHIN